MYPITLVIRIIFNILRTNRASTVLLISYGILHMYVLGISISGHVGMKWKERKKYEWEGRERKE